MDEDGRLHANYKLTGTVTGRLSSGKLEDSRGPGLNVQQVPRDPFIRGIIGAPRGWRFVEADFSQVELRIAAHLSRDPTLQRLYALDEDVHLTTAMQVTGKPADQISKEERKKAKAVNFGFLYGMGAPKFVDYARDSYGVVVTPEEAEHVRRRFFETFSSLPAWHARQRRLVQQYGRVQSAIGRVRHLPDINSSDKGVRGEAERQAINSPVQSLASDLMLLSLVTLYDEMDPREAVIVGTVHDSILFEIKDEAADRWVKRIREVMENLPVKKKFGLDLTVPIKVDIKVGDHWGEGEEL
jgi:DNA polymerase-1